MIFDTSICDGCQVKNICIRKRTIEKIEDLVNQSYVKNKNGSGSDWPLKTYLQDDNISEFLPISISCRDAIRMYSRGVNRD